ncbi:MAG: amino acid ABC transporter permease [Oligoflexales bacterium]
MIQRRGLAKIWYDVRFRGVLQQLILAIVVFALASVIARNTIQNLTERNIASGFDFLSSTAGFDINFHLIDYSETSSYRDALLVGILNTLLVSVIGIFFATILGFVLGVMRVSKNFLVASFAAFYVEVVRNIPLLLQIFFWYFAVLRTLPAPRESIAFGDKIFLNLRGLFVPRPMTEGSVPLFLIGIFAVIGALVYFGRRLRARRVETGSIPRGVYAWIVGAVLGPAVVYKLAGLSVHWEIPQLQGFNFQGGYVLSPELVSLGLSLSIYTASFIAEIVRSGINATPKGQTEAAFSLGLTRMQSLRLIVIPQALRVIVPPLTSQFLNLTKNSSLGAAIAYPDIVLVFAGTVLMQTGQAVEVMFITMAFYLVICLIISLFMNWYNKRISFESR